MASSVHHVNNINIKCSMCDNKMTNGIMRDGYYYCNTNCYQNKMFFDTLSQPQAQPVQIQQKSVPRQPQALKTSPAPNTAQKSKEDCRYYGTCDTCRNKYDCKFGCVDMGDKWFCSQTCSRVYSSGNNMQFPAVAFPFAPNTYTVFPLHVDARAGKLIF